jgi:hypothetical protein
MTNEQKLPELPEFDEELIVVPSYDDDNRSRRKKFSNYYQSQRSVCIIGFSWTHRHDNVLRNHLVDNGGGATCRVISANGKTTKTINGAIVGNRHILTHKSIFENNPNSTFHIEYYTKNNIKDRYDMEIRLVKASIVNVHYFDNGMAIAMLGSCLENYLKYGLGVLENNTKTICHVYFPQNANTIRQMYYSGNVECDDMLLTNVLTGSVSANKAKIIPGGRVKPGQYFLLSDGFFIEKETKIGDFLYKLEKHPVTYQKTYTCQPSMREDIENNFEKLFFLETDKYEMKDGWIISTQNEKYTNDVRILNKMDTSAGNEGSPIYVEFEGYAILIGLNFGPYNNPGAFGIYFTESIVKTIHSVINKIKDTDNPSTKVSKFCLD